MLAGAKIYILSVLRLLTNANYASQDMQLRASLFAFDNNNETLITGMPQEMETVSMEITSEQTTAAGPAVESLETQR